MWQMHILCHKLPPLFASWHVDEGIPQATTLLYHFNVILATSIPLVNCRSCWIAFYSTIWHPICKRWRMMANYKHLRAFSLFILHNFYNWFHTSSKQSAFVFQVQTFLGDMVISFLMPPSKVFTVVLCPLWCFKVLIFNPKIRGFYNSGFTNFILQHLCTIGPMQSSTEGHFAIQTSWNFLLALCDFLNVFGRSFVKSSSYVSTSMGISWTLSPSVATLTITLSISFENSIINLQSSKSIECLQSPLASCEAFEGPTFLWKATIAMVLVRSFILELVWGLFTTTFF